MEEIKFGDYIRTHYKIRRVTNSNFYMSQYVECGEDLVWKNDIKKHSKNITDLIEPGDYVNGLLVTSISVGIEKIICCDFWNNKTMICKNIYEKDIKSIVTKEQFAKIEYRLEE